MEEQQYSIENSIKRVEDALHDKSLSTKQISSLKSELYILKQELETRERIIAEEYRECLKKNGESYRITFIQSERGEIGIFWKKYISIIEPRLDEIEHKRLKTKSQKKSDGWRAPNKNQNKPVCRY